MPWKHEEVKKLKIDWIEIGLDKWHVKPKSWAKLVERFSFTERVEGDTYCAWNTQLGIFITGNFEEEDRIKIPDYYGALDFAPTLTIKELATFLNRLFEASYTFSEMDIDIGIGSSSFIHPPDWLREIMES